MILKNKPVNIRILGKLDINPYLEFINDFNFKIENKYNREIIFTNCTTAFIVERGTINDQFNLEKFLSISSDLLSLIQLTYGPGSIYSLQISKMPPKANIQTHFDNGIVFDKAHRVHTVVKTNHDTTFNACGNDYSFQVGTVFELNNTKLHSVRNNSPDEERVHLIIDYLPKYVSKFKR